MKTKQWGETNLRNGNELPSMNIKRSDESTSPNTWGRNERERLGDATEIGERMSFRAAFDHESSMDTYEALISWDTPGCRRRRDLTSKLPEWSLRSDNSSNSLSLCNGCWSRYEKLKAVSPVWATFFVTDRPFRRNCEIFPTGILFPEVFSFLSEDAVDVIFQQSKQSKTKRTTCEKAKLNEVSIEVIDIQFNPQKKRKWSTVTFHVVEYSRNLQSNNSRFRFRILILKDCMRATKNVKMSRGGKGEKQKERVELSYNRASGDFWIRGNWKSSLFSISFSCSFFFSPVLFSWGISWSFYHGVLFYDNCIVTSRIHKTIARLHQRSNHIHLHSLEKKLKIRE